MLKKAYKKQFDQTCFSCRVNVWARACLQDQWIDLQKLATLNLICSVFYSPRIWSTWNREELFVAAEPSTHETIKPAGPSMRVLYSFFFKRTGPTGSFLSYTESLRQNSINTVQEVVER